jgi:hypothetical protein
MCCPECRCFGALGADVAARRDRFDLKISKVELDVATAALLDVLGL